jgi:hypothetical protein
MKKAQTTTGYEHILLSVISFNGSGYADMNDAETFLDSYIAYSKWKGREEHVRDAQAWYNELLVDVDALLERTDGASRLPSEKNLRKFAGYYPEAANWVDQPLPGQLSLV